MKLRASYAVVYQNPRYILIEDLNDGCSVTNDAEAVVLDVDKHLKINDRQLFYIDSEGNIDELVVVQGKFQQFKTCPDEIRQQVQKGL